MARAYDISTPLFLRFSYVWESLYKNFQCICIILSKNYTADKRKENSEKLLVTISDRKVGSHSERPRKLPQKSKKFPYS